MWKKEHNLWFIIHCFAFIWVSRFPKNLCWINQDMLCFLYPIIFVRVTNRLKIWTINHSITLGRREILFLIPLGFQVTDRDPNYKLSVYHSIGSFFIIVFTYAHLLGKDHPFLWKTLLNLCLLISIWICESVTSISPIQVRVIRIKSFTGLPAAVFSSYSDLVNVFILFGFVCFRIPRLCTWVAH